MKLTISRSSAGRALLAVALLALLTSIVVGRERDNAGVVEPVVGNVKVAVAGKADRHAGSSKKILDLDLERLNRPKTEEVGTSLFGSHSWYSPPPPRPVVAAPPPPPPPPTAPPLPFAYLGKLVDGSEIAVFLARGDQNHSVRAGDVVDSTYRVDQVGENAVVFTYIPLDIKQTLTVGGQIDSSR